MWLEFFFSSRRRHTRCSRDWSSDVCSSDLLDASGLRQVHLVERVVVEEAGGARRDAVLEIQVQRLRRDRLANGRSEERRVGKECRSRWRPYQQRKKSGQAEAVGRWASTWK